MSGDKEYRYSLFERFVGIIFLLFMSIILVFLWEIKEQHQKNSSRNLLEISLSINQHLTNSIRNAEIKLGMIASVLSNLEPNREDIYHKARNHLAIKSHFIDEKWLPVYIQEEVNIQILKNLSHNENLVLHDVSTHNIEFLKSHSTIEDGLIIPAFMKINDSKTSKLSYLVTGVYLNKIKEELNELITNTNQNAFYALVQTSENEILLNSNISDEKKNIIFLNHLDQVENKYHTDTFFYEDEVNKYAISKISNHPFAIVVGIKQVLEFEDYIHQIMTYKYQLLMIIILICSLIYLFYSSILQPFLLLSSSAHKISQGDVNTETPIIYSKEGSDVARALNKIKNYMKKEKFLIKEISDTHNLLSLTNLRLENQVLERTQELENNIAEKTAFLSNLSHEIKVPMQAVTNLAEDLTTLWKEFSEEKKHEIVNQILTSSKSILLLLKNILDLAKYSSNKIELKMENFNLVSSTSKVVAEFKSPQTTNREISFNLLNEDPIYINGDKLRIKHVLRNLIQNAILFSPFQGKIAINIVYTKILLDDGSRHDAVHFAIHDQGLGIPDEELSTIFSPFAQGSNSKNRTYASGLGLAICKDIINIHHGKIWVMNNKDGGATFNFIIPINQPNFKTTYTPGSISLNKTEPNILLVDDEEICLNSMDMMLYGSRYNLIKTKSANFALKFLKENGHVISLVFIDLMMPEMYGLNLLAEIKKIPKLRNIPIILQTSSSDEEELVKAVDSGVLSLIRKPYNKKILLNEIDKAVHFKKVNK